MGILCSNTETEQTLQKQNYDTGDTVYDTRERNFRKLGRMPSAETDSENSIEVSLMI